MKKTFFKYTPARINLLLRHGLLLLPALLCFASTLSAQAIWEGSTNSDWNTASNWNPATVPTATVDVTIPDVANDPVIAAGAVAKSVSVKIGASLTINATGSLTINGSSPHPNGTTGLYNSGTVSNSGNIILGSSASPGQYGIYSGGTFNNNTGGEIRIDRTTTTGLYNLGGVFTNTAKITIGAVASAGDSGIRNDGTFNNNTGGEISIDRLNGIGMFCTTGAFTNAAKITIGAAASVGDWGIFSGGTFNNNTGGEISIDRTADAGVVDAGGVFTNAAKITIGATATVGQYGIYSQATFNNNTDGEISIDRSTTYGLYNAFGAFTNAAKITIGATASVGTWGIYSKATFNNSPCALLSMFAPLFNNSAFTNSGLFTVNTIGAHTNTALTNDGILEYPLGNPIPNVTNNDVIARPISGGCTISNALQLGGAVSFTAGTTWYLDQNLSSQAGTYNQATNVFAPTNLPSGVPTTVYLSVLDDVNDCSQVVSVKVTFAPEGCITVDAGTCQAVYYGYAPMACTTLTAVAANGVPPYTYMWSNGATTASITVCPTTTTVYTVTATDATNSSASDPVTVEVVDVRCGNNMDKVQLCHNGTNNMCIAPGAVPDHLSHGDVLGDCGAPAPCSGENYKQGRTPSLHASGVSSTAVAALFPNPASGEVWLDLSAFEGSAVAVRLTDMRGALIQEFSTMEASHEQVRLDLSRFAAGFYFVRIQPQDGQVQTLKLVLDRKE